MTNMMDYLLWRGDVRLSGTPFNEVDNLILTQLVYLDYTGILPDGAELTLEEAAQKYAEQHPALETEEMSQLFRNCSELLLAAAKTERFRRFRLSHYERAISPEEESQFAALRFMLEDGSLFVAFSGTDTSVIGWRENFNMGFLSSTPSQVKALAYLKAAAEDFQGSIRVGGHSKGGNEAVYAAMHLDPALQEKLSEIYNNDGPGFTDKMISIDGYRAILSRTRTFLPESSIVGLLLEHDEDYQVIRSTGVGPLQHDAFTWAIVGREFVYLDSLSKSSLVMDKALKVWVNGMDDERRKHFVDALFSILQKSHIEDTDELSHMNWSEFVELIRAAGSLDAADKDVLTKTIKALLTAYFAIKAQRSAEAEKESLPLRLGNRLRRELRFGTRGDVPAESSGEAASAPESKAADTPE